VYRAVRERVPRVSEDRPLGDAIEALAVDVLAGGFDAAVEPWLAEGARA